METSWAPDGEAAEVKKMQICSPGRSGTAARPVREGPSGTRDGEPRGLPEQRGNCMRAAEAQEQQVALERPCRDQNRASLQEQFLQKDPDSVGCHESVNFTAACRLLEGAIHMDTITCRKRLMCCL